MLGEQFTGAHLRRRQQTTGRRIRRVFQSFIRAVDTDQHLGLVIVRREILVGHRPVEAEPVSRVRLKIIGPVPERDPAPVIRAAAEHPRAPPPELSCRIARRTGVGLAGHLPAAIDRRVVETKGFIRRARTAQRGLIVGLKHRRFLYRVVVSPRFEHEDLRALHRERVGRLATAGTGADHDHIVNRLRLAGANVGHSENVEENFAERQPLFMLDVRAPQISPALPCADCDRSRQ